MSGKVQFGGANIRTVDIPHEPGYEALVVSIENGTTLPANRIEQLLDLTGDGSGSVQMAAGTAAYKIVPAAGDVYELTRLNIYIEDNGALRGDYYGATGALANGITVTVEDASGTISTLTPQAVKTVGLWGLVAGVDVFLTSFAAGNDFFIVRWTFAKGGGPILLDGDSGEFLAVNINDNLGVGGAALVSHLAQVQGKKFTK